VERSILAGKIISEIKITTLADDEYGIWDDIVQRSPQATVFHQLNWLKIIEKHTQSKLYLFVGSLGNQTIAAIPFFYRKQGIFKTLSSPLGGSMVQNLGPIFPDYESLKQNKREFYFREFCKELNEFLVKKIKPNFISITTSPNLLDARPFIWTGYEVNPKYNYVQNITNLDIIWHGFKKQLRKNIEKAEHEGFIIDQVGLEGYQFIIESLSQRLHQQEIGFPASKEYLLDIFNAYYPGNLEIFIAKINGVPMTGIVVTKFRNTLSIWIGATQTELKGIYPVDLLQWKIIEWGNKNGYEKCEILGANIPSISYFKSRYNFDLEIYYSVQKLRGIYRIINILRSIVR